MAKSSNPSDLLPKTKRRTNPKRLIQVQPIEKKNIVLAPKPITIVPPKRDVMKPRRGRKPGDENPFKGKLTKMFQLGNFVRWNLKNYQNDRKILTKKCEEIGITRDQFRGWVYHQKKAVRFPIRFLAELTAAGAL